MILGAAAPDVSLRNMLYSPSYLFMTPCDTLCANGTYVITDGSAAVPRLIIGISDVTFAALLNADDELNSVCFIASP
jgi:hypothetical protein